MKLQHTLGDKEKTEIVIERNWFTGSFIYRENGEENRIKSPWRLSTHFNWKLSREYDFEIGEEEKHSIKIIHSRPRWFGGICPQTVELSVNGDLLETYTGY